MWERRTKKKEKKEKGAKGKENSEKNSLTLKHKLKFKNNNESVKTKDKASMDSTKRIMWSNL